MKTDGIILINKPIGWTSHDVVAKVRNILKKESGQKVRVGHTGTLDPLASGLMILVIGSYTKKAQEFSKLDKTYEVEMTLGKKSSTGDSEGRITNISDKKPSKMHIKNAIANLLGTIEQVPPQYSAIKVGGQRAYRLARAGKEVKLEPRKVTIKSMELTNYNYPKVSFRAHVSSGTYIRTLAEDIGDKLGTGAYLISLKRTTVGKYKIEKATSIDKMTNNVL